MLRSFVFVCVLLSLAACSSVRTVASAPPDGRQPNSANGLVSPDDNYYRQIIGQYTIRKHGGVDPGEDALGSDGNIYFTEGLRPYIGRITPTASIAEYAIPSGAVGGAIAPGDPGALWFTESDRIGTISTAGAITEYQLPAQDSPIGIVLGPDHNIWFTDAGSNSIGRIGENGQGLVEFPLPTPNALPHDITVGADGNLWFTESAGDNIGRITPTGAIDEYSIPLAGAYPMGIVQGPDGFIYATAYNAPNLIRAWRNGKISIVPCCSGHLYGRQIISGEVHKLWISLDDGTGKIGTISKYNWLTGKTSPPLPIPDDSLIGGMTVVADGDVWFTARGGYVGGYIGVWEVDSRIIGMRLNGEMSIEDPNYGFELGYSLGYGMTTQTISLEAGHSVQFQNLDTIPHSAALLGDATQNFAPWPAKFNGGTTASPEYTAVGAPGFSTGPVAPYAITPRYNTGMPGFYMIGCQFDYNTDEMRTVLVVQ
jgi:streptogramin lyase